MIGSPEGGLVGVGRGRARLARSGEHRPGARGPELLAQARPDVRAPMTSGHADELPARAGDDRLLRSSPGVGPSLMQMAERAAEPVTPAEGAAWRSDSRMLAFVHLTFRNVLGPRL